MNEHTLIAHLEALTTEELAQILEGYALVVVDDKHLAIGKKVDAFTLYSIDREFDDKQALKKYLLTHAVALLRNYYEQNPLSKVYFNAELKDIVAEVGAKALMRMPDNENVYSILVEGDKVGLLDEADFRFKYGLFFDSDEKLPPLAVENKIKNWISSGEAYADYISMNVCKFCVSEE